MKILHTSDWHLGKKLKNFERIEEQKEVITEICNIADYENVDIVVISGDIFDNLNPSEEVRSLFFKALKRLSNYGKRIVIGIAGNHDSPKAIETPYPLSKDFGILLIGFLNTRIENFKLDSGIEIFGKEEGMLEIKFPNFLYPLRILYAPYANESRIGKSMENEEEVKKFLIDRWNYLAEKYCDNKGVNLFVGHVLIMNNKIITSDEDEERNIGGIGEIYIEGIPNQIQYAALGHLHRMQLINEKNKVIAYSGSPLAYSFSETDQEKFVIIVNATPENLSFKEILLKNGEKLLKRKFNSIKQAEEFLRNLKNDNNNRHYVELTISTENFLSPEDKRRLYEIYDKDRIVDIIPDIQNRKNFMKRNININDNIENLFIEYFKHKYSKNPNEEILNLFKEMLAQD